jgi:hypothetical protein
MGAGGTFRCVHGYYMAPYDKDGKEIRYVGTDYADYGIGNDGTITLTSDGDNCSLIIPGGFWLNVMDGCNFTHIIDSEQRINDYIARHGERFMYVGHSKKPISWKGITNEDIWHLVF